MLPLKLNSTARSAPGFLLCVCVPFCSTFAAEPVRTDLPSRTGQAQAIPEEPALGGTLATAVPAQAGTGVYRYEATFFDEFQPTTALDMVRRLPGFNFEKGDITVRGFAAALGNVLIDGQRPASKTVTLEDVLRRIPVSNVASVEVIRGGAPGINMQGQSVVANVVRSGGDMSSKVGELTGLFAEKHDPGIGVRLEATRTTGNLSMEGALNFRDEQQYGSSGTGSQVRRDANRTLIEASRFETDWRQRQLQASGLAEYQTEAGVLRVNLGGVSLDVQQLDELSPVDYAPRSIRGLVNTSVRTDTGEAGVDYEHPLNDALIGRVLLIQSIEKEIVTANADNPAARQRSDDEALQGESILRSSLTYRSSSRLTIEGGLEGAYNFLEVDASLQRNGIPVPLPADNIQIKERRGEAFVDSRWKFTPRLSSDIGMRYEMSTISQSGDSQARRSLSFLKPRATLRFDLNSDVQLRGRIERTVSQLEFRDFASKASLDAGTISSGNANLLPESAWEFEAAIEKRFWGNGAVVFGYTQGFVTDVVDMVPVAGFDTVGNIGDGERGKVAVSLSLPLEQIGLQGTLLRFNGSWTWSKVDDPVTGQERRISRNAPLGGDFVLTKEFPGLSSTLSLEDGFSKRDTSYRIEEVRTDHWDHFFRLYWDWTPKADTVVRLMFNNFTSRPRSRWRTVYDGTRASGQIAFHEDRHIDAERYIQVQLRKTF